MRFDYFGVEQGLSQSVIYTIFQDSKGFLWIGTHDGLNRYDGYEFKKYYNNPLDSNSMAENIVYHIQEDAQGYLWIKTIHYLHRFNPKTNQFTKFKIPAKAAPISWKSNSPILTRDLVPVDNYFNAWVFHIPSSTFILLKYADGTSYMSSGTQRNNLQLHQGKIIAPGKTGIVYFDTVQLLLQPLRSITYGAFKDEQLIYLQASGEHLMAISKQGVLIVVNNKRKITRQISASDTLSSSIAGICVDTRKVVWVATSTGLYNLPPGEVALKKISLRFLNNQPASSAVNKCLTADRQGNLWLGSFGDGMRKLNVHQRNIINLGFAPGDNGLPGKFVQSLIQASGGDIYATFYDTRMITQMNPFGKKISNIEPSQFINNRYLAKILLKEQYDSFEKLPVFAAYLSKTNFLNESNPLLYRDKRGHTWQRKDYSLACESLGTKIQAGSLIEGFTEDDSANFWIATSANGLGFWQRKNQQISFYTNEQGLSSNNINALLYDGYQQCLWLGTHMGLNKFDLAKKTTLRYNSNDGLCHNSVYNMVTDQMGNLWLGTGNGISRFDTHSKRFKNFNRRDGLLNMEYNRYSAIRLTNGMLAFGGTQGIDIFDPGEMNQTNIAPDVMITGIKVLDRSIYPGDTTLQLKHHENNLTISFAAMDFTNPGKTQYAYHLKGTDKNWNYIEGVHTVSYASLEPGNYSFMVKAANDAGEWNEQHAKLDFIIKKVWWQTGWFYLTLAIMLCTIIYLFVRYRWKKKIELLQLRNRIHRDLHDDVGATLSTMKAYTQMLKERPGQTEFLELISQNADNMLDKLELITWASNPSNDSMHSLTEKIQQLLTPLFYHKGIELNFFAEDNLKNIELPGLVRQNLFLIFKEGANNIIKYAGANSCSIRIVKEGAFILLELKDNGKGFDVKTVKNGNGLKNIAERASELNGIFSLHAAVNEGTLIQIKIPSSFFS